MFRLMKAAMPAASSIANITTISTRCRNANATTPFIGLILPCRPNRRRGGRGYSSLACGSPINKQAAADHDLFSGLEPADHLDQIAIGSPGLDRSWGQTAVRRDDPDACGFAFIDNGAFRNTWSGNVITGEDREIRKHLRFEKPVAIVDIGANREPVRVGVHRGRYIGDLRLENPAGKRQHANLNLIAYMHE